MSTIEHILVATDRSAPPEWAMARAATPAQLHGASLDLVHIVSSTFLGAIRLPPAGEVVDPDPLVLGKHRRSVVEHWMVGSVTAHLARAVECDVLAVPEAGP